MSTWVLLVPIFFCLVALLFFFNLLVIVFFCNFWLELTSWFLKVVRSDKGFHPSWGKEYDEISIHWLVIKMGWKPRALNWLSKQISKTSDTREIKKQVELESYLGKLYSQNANSFWSFLNFILFLYDIYFYSFFLLDD